MSYVLYDQNIFKSVWLDKVKANLDGIGMSNRLNYMKNTKYSWFKNTIKLKLNDSYNQSWSVYVFNNSACLNYTAMADQKQLQRYLLCLPKQYLYNL